MWELGAENRQDYILKCVFVGPSTKNTRIERLWRAYNCSKMMKWKRLFTRMERDHGLDRHNSVYLWCLHFVYLPRLNRELDAWVQGPNAEAHPGYPEPQLRRTLLQRFTEGMQHVFTDEFRNQMLQRDRAGLDINGDLSQQDNN